MEVFTLINHMTLLFMILAETLTHEPIFVTTLPISSFYKLFTNLIHRHLHGPQASNI